MAYSFEEIMAYHPDNKSVYDEIQKLLPGNSLVPFVGAGLTAFAYGTWPGALKSLTEKITDTETKCKIRQLIQDNKLLDAAQALEDARSPNNLAHNLVELFSAENLKKKSHLLPREAISLLPHLFPNNLVLTTNFDEVLETVYQNPDRRPIAVFHPGQPELLLQFLRAGGNQGLLKLHGTIIGSNIDYSKIVFTERQYDQHYSPDSELVADLTACFRQRIMLFLGCSLEQDRTMELLQQIRQPGMDNYAILDCPESERDARIRELGQMGIRAIVYEKGRYEAVRVILEKLLEDTQPDDYQRLPVRVGELRSLSTTRFAYNADLISFTGRKEELGLLQDFLGEPDIAFRWWAIVGPGGSGKSRLAYEFQKQLQGTDWDVQWLAREDYGNLSALTPKLTKPTLLIADYVQQYAQELGQWMQNLVGRHRSQPLRLLLVERDSSQAEGGFSWERQLYLQVADTGKLEKARFAQFLELQPLDDSSLGEIMTHYAAAPPSKRTLPEKAKAMLLERLHSVDPDLQRPLYALFLTDAWLEKPENPERWNREDVLNYVTRREQGRLKQSIHDTFGKPIPALHRACLRLYAMATVCQDATYGKLEEHCPKDWKTVDDKASDYGGAKELLQAIGLGNKDGVDALRPDLVGEYFVLSWLLEQKGQAQAFLQTAWQNPKATFVFLNRTIHDYAHLLNESPAYWQLLFPDIHLESPDAALLAAHLLVNAIYYCTIPAECARLAGQLEAIAAAYPNKEITIDFADGLVNLSMHQDAQGRADTVSRLEQLRDDHPDVPEIAIEFTQGLVNLSAEQNAMGASNTISRLEQLMEQHPDIPEIAIAFAMGLANLTIQQDATEATKTLHRLEQLMNDHPGVPEIEIDFAQGLVNLAIQQDATEATKTLHRLEQLMNDHPGVPEIAIQFAKGLSNLSNYQDVTEAAKTVYHLEQLRNDLPGVSEIAIAFAGGLVNLSTEQDAAETVKTLRRLERLTDQHPDIPEIAIEFARGLLGLVLKQDAMEREGTIQRLKSLADGTVPVPDIAAEFAQCCLTVLTASDAKTRQTNLARMQQIRASLNLLSSPHPQ